MAGAKSVGVILMVALLLLITKQESIPALSLHRDGAEPQSGDRDVP